MPSALVDDRLALDETSLDFRGIGRDDLERLLDQLSDTIADLKDQGLAVRVHPWLWGDVECLDSVTVTDFFYDAAVTDVDRDTRRRLGVLLDRCPSWPEETPGFLESVEFTPASAAVPPLDLAIAFSLGVVLVSGRRMACLAFGHGRPTGLWRVSSGTRSAEAYVFATASDLPTFWRSLYAAEKVAEAEFFSLAIHAFPGLVFHPDLGFGAFEGDYRDLRDRVVEILSGLNDHFAQALRDHSGLSHEVQAALGAHRVDLSPEAPGTRGSARLMAKRTVHFDGRSYLCEWHAKLERHRNRIHFSLPADDLDGRVLVGIFARHLDT